MLLMSWRITLLIFGALVVVALAASNNDENMATNDSLEDEPETLSYVWSCKDMTPDLCDDLIEERGFFETWNGLQVAYWIFSRPIKKNNSSFAPPLPIVHVSGGPGMPHNLDLPRQALACLDPGRRIILYDQGGSGASSIPNNASASDNGLQVAYWIFSRPIKKNNSSFAPPLPIVHVSGGPGMPHNLDLPRQALACLDPGRRIILYDQGGSGASSIPNNASASDPDYDFLLDINYFAQELFMLIQALELDEYHIVAHSWGT